MTKKIRMPNVFYDDLAKLISLNKDELHAIVADFKTVSVKSPSLIVEDLGEKHDLAEEQIQDFISMMILLSRIKKEFKNNYDELLNDLILKELLLKKDEYKLDKNQIDNFILEIKNLLSNENFLILLKISRLQNEIPNKILESTIYSDIRYVFSEDPTNIPTHSIINHSLKLTIRELSRINEFYFGLDGEELINLRNTIDRAIKKDHSLRKLCKQNQIEVINEILEEEC